MIATAAAVFSAEMAAAGRRRGAFAGLVLFSLALLLVGQAAFSPGPGEAARLLPGLVWSAGLLASGVGLARLWDAEGDQGLLDALLATPADRSGLVLGKALWGAVVATGVLAVTAAAGWVLFSPAAPSVHLGGMAAAFVLGGVGLGAVGALFGALATGLATRDLLVPLLLFPAVIPLLLAGVALTSAALEGAPPGGRWLALLAAYDAVAVLLAAGLGEAAVEP